MQLKVFPMRALVLCAALSIVSGCATQAVVSPPVADLQVQGKPQATADIVTSEQAAVAYDNAVEAWGETGWLQVGRLCRWAEANKLPHPACPKP